MRRHLFFIAAAIAAALPLPSHAGAISSECIAGFIGTEGASCDLVMAGPNLRIEIEAYADSAAPVRAGAYAVLTAGPTRQWIGECIVEGASSESSSIRCVYRFGPGEAYAPVMTPPAGMPLQCTVYGLGTSFRIVEAKCSSNSI